MEQNNNNETTSKSKVTWKQAIRKGYAQIRHNRIKTIIFIIVTMILGLFIYNYKNNPNTFSLGIEFFDDNKVITLISDLINIFIDVNLPSNILIPILAGGIYLLLIAILVITIGSSDYEENCFKTGIVNNAKEPPIFIRKYRNPFNRKEFIVEYLSNATSYEEQWLKLRGKLDGAFDGYFIKGMRKKKSNRKIIQLNLTKEQPDYSKPIYLKLEIINKNHKHFKIPIGLNDFSEPVYWDLIETPHTFVGGQTRRGKTILEKLIKSYCLRSNDCDVWSFDFKRWC